MTARVATALQELGKTLLQQKEKPRREELSHAQSRSYQAPEPDQLPRTPFICSSPFVLSWCQISWVTCFICFQFRGGAIVNGIWNIVQDGSLAMIPFSAHQSPSHFGWGPRRSCSLFMFNSFLLSTQEFYLDSFVWLWPAHCFFFERKWLNMIEQHEWRKWCEAVDSVTRYILPCSFGKKIFAISKHEPWVSFREQILNIFCVECVKDVKFAWRYFMIFHVRSVGIAQEDAADVEKLLFCNWCGDFSEYRHNAIYHAVWPPWLKTQECEDRVYFRPSLCI